MQAELIGGTTWRVTDGAQSWEVAVKASANTAEAAIAAVEEAADPPAPSQEALTMISRAGMNPYRRAFREAMFRTPFPNAPHMLAAFDAAVEAARAQNPYSSLVKWADDVTQIIRLHPDMETFGAAFGLTATDLDALCALAVDIEAGRA